MISREESVFQDDDLGSAAGFGSVLGGREAMGLVDEDIDEGSRTSTNRMHPFAEFADSVALNQTLKLPSLRTSSM